MPACLPALQCLRCARGPLPWSPAPCSASPQRCLWPRKQTPSRPTRAALSATSTHVEKVLF